jgi:signal peptidase II
VKRSFSLLLGVAAAVVAADRWTKHWATIEFQGREPVNVIGEFVRFTYTLNSGVAFGLGAGLPFPYAVFSIVAVGVILYLFLRQPTHSPARQWALALILGGALGNLIDRVQTGEVVDFILVGWRGWYWPVFNVADSAVTAGVLLFGLTWARHTEAQLQGGGAGSAAVADPLAAPAPEEPRDPDGGTTAAATFPEASDVPHAAAVGAADERGGAGGPLPRAGAGGPVA